MFNKFLPLVGIVAILLTACATEPPSRYKLKDDRAPEGSFDFSNVPDAVPKWEPLSAGGNRSPYKVRGKTYRVLDSAQGYVKEGVASWYGLKFHGELTSNGETYNMYEMSAAHKSLPLPTYLRVTNLDNQKTVIVRVNDRGPFHSERVIDLSFAAANRLGFADKGTARVRLEAITPEPPASVSKSVPVSNSVKGVAKVEAPSVIARSASQRDRLAPFVQIAAFSNLEAADALKNRIAQEYGRADVFVASATKSGKLIHRVRVGPFGTQQAAKQFRQLTERDRVGSPIVISRSILGKDQ